MKTTEPELTAKGIYGEVLVAYIRFQIEMWPLTITHIMNIQDAEEFLIKLTQQIEQAKLQAKLFFQTLQEKEDLENEQKRAAT